MRKWLIETAFISLAVGVYIFYGQPLVDWLKIQLAVTLDSSQLYAVGAFLVVLGSTLVGKVFTRGMK